MPSVGEQIVQAMVDVLNAPSDKPCITYRSRIDAINARELPAFVLYAISEAPGRRSPNVYLRTRKVRLEAMVEGEPPADEQTDPLYVYAVNTLLAASEQEDGPLRGLIRKLWQSDVQWEAFASYEDRCIAFIDFELDFVTAGDPTVRVDA